MSAELELRLLLAVCAILYITGFVQLCIERSSYREAKKELEARQKEQPERHVRREPLFTPCGTPPGLCPHARKQIDLYGGYYWACEDAEIPWNPAETAYGAQTATEKKEGK